MRSLATAATGMLAQQLNVEVISNNIANLNTIGFKRQRAEFQDLLYQNVEAAGATSSASGTIVPSGVQVGLGVKAGSVYRIDTQGNLNQTNNPLDIAIEGDGYFIVRLPTGEDAYTRAGNFAVSANGELVTEDGYPLQPGVVLPEDRVRVNINAAGFVEVFVEGAAAGQQVGQITLARFINSTGLEARGDNLFLETAASGPAVIGNPDENGFGRLRQNFIETSNVDSVREITALIAAQRAYEMNAQVITTSDEMLQAANNVR